MVGVSTAAGRHDDDDDHHGTVLLPADLTEDQLAAAPVLTSVDALVIEPLADDEDEAFAAALLS